MAQSLDQLREQYDIISFNHSNLYDNDPRKLDAEILMDIILTKIKWIDFDIKLIEKIRILLTDRYNMIDMLSKTEKKSIVKIKDKDFITLCKYYKIRKQLNSRPGSEKLKQQFSRLTNSISTIKNQRVIYMIQELLFPKVLIEIIIKLK